MLFSGHFLIFPFVKYVTDALCPTNLNVYITISPLFLFVFIIIDQILCFLCLFKTGKGETKKMSKKRIFQSVWYGFLNCKTYYCVLFPLLFGCKFPVTAWILDIALGLSNMVSLKIVGYWELMFYHAHRISHINFVYPDAHKFHHYLHDSTAFDAHIFGSGAPEEWLMIIVEYLMAISVCGNVIPSMSYFTLNISWYNKWGFHSRCKIDENNSDNPYPCQNHHADHHTFHNKNFGAEYPLDMVMNTTHQCPLDYNGFKITRKESNIVSIYNLQQSKARVNDNDNDNDDKAQNLA